MNVKMPTITKVTSNSVSIFEILDSRTLKKSCVDPELSVPYAISVCLIRSSGPSIGVSSFSMVRKAARLAV